MKRQYTIKAVVVALVLLPVVGCGPSFLEGQTVGKVELLTKMDAPPAGLEEGRGEELNGVLLRYSAEKGQKLRYEGPTIMWEVRSDGRVIKRDLKRTAMEITIQEEYPDKSFLRKTTVGDGVVISDRVTPRGELVGRGEMVMTVEGTLGLTASRTHKMAIIQRDADFPMDKVRIGDRWQQTKKMELLQLPGLVSTDRVQELTQEYHVIGFLTHRQHRCIVIEATQNWEMLHKFMLKKQEVESKTDSSLRTLIYFDYKGGKVVRTEGFVVTKQGKDSLIDFSISESTSELQE